MNILRSDSHKNRKVRHGRDHISEQTAAFESTALPDVVANLSLSYSGHFGSDCNSAMLAHLTSGYSQDSNTDNDHRGLSAAPQNISCYQQAESVHHDSEVSGCSPSNWSSERYWMQPSSPTRSSRSPHPQRLQHGRGPTFPQKTLGRPPEAGARIRSVSTGPRGQSNLRSEKRNRCSSASRIRVQRLVPSQVDLEPSSSSRNTVESVRETLDSSANQSLQHFNSSQRESSLAEVLSQDHNNCDYPQRDVYSHKPTEDPRTALETYGYQVSDLEALLSQASPGNPANLPMVIASSTRLHNMKRTVTNKNANYPPMRPFLPLGIIVNAVFKTRDWLYVRTAHGAEGYVPYRICLPLGILPTNSSLHEPGPNRSMITPCSAEVQTIPQGHFHNGSHNVANSSSTLEGNQARGRSRGRKKIHERTTNQTDSQKLYPPVNTTLTLRN